MMAYKMTPQVDLNEAPINDKVVDNALNRRVLQWLAAAVGVVVTLFIYYNQKSEARNEKLMDFMNRVETYMVTSMKDQDRIKDDTKRNEELLREHIDESTKHWKAIEQRVLQLEFQQNNRPK